MNTQLQDMINTPKIRPSFITFSKAFSDYPIDTLHQALDSVLTMMFNAGETKAVNFRSPYFLRTLLNNPDRMMLLHRLLNATTTQDTDTEDLITIDTEEASEDPNPENLITIDTEGLVEKEPGEMDDDLATQVEALYDLEGALNTLKNTEPGKGDLLGFRSSVLEGYPPQAGEELSFWMKRVEKAEGFEFTAVLKKAKSPKNQWKHLRRAFNKASKVQKA